MQLIEDTVKATWVRKQRVDLVSSDTLSGTSETKVDIILEVQNRGVPWTAFLDVGGLKR